MSLIGVSCGHRVPRKPVLSEPRSPRGQRTKLYWCERCGEYRMSGSRSTGERGFDFLLQLRDDIASHEIPIVVPDPGTERGRAIVRALGGEIAGELAYVDDAQAFYLEAIERMRRIEQGERIPPESPGAHERPPECPGGRSP